MQINEMTIMICDDSMVARKKLKDYITSLNCKEVIEAANGREAVKIYARRLPDLVFMDIIMPEVDGIDAVTEIIKNYPIAKIVMVSSVGTQSYLQNAIIAGAYDFLQKPINNDNVKKIIYKLAEGDK